MSILNIGIYEAGKDQIKIRELQTKNGVKSKHAAKTIHMKFCKYWYTIDRRMYVII